MSGLNRKLMKFIWDFLKTHGLLQSPARDPHNIFKDHFDIFSYTFSPDLYKLQAPQNLNVLLQLSPVV